MIFGVSIDWFSLLLLSCRALSLSGFLGGSGKGDSLLGGALRQDHVTVGTERENENKKSTNYRLQIIDSIASKQ